MIDNGLKGIVPIKKLRTEKRIPPAIRGTMYEAMLLAVSDELVVWRAGIAELKTTFYDIDVINTDRLTSLANEFGVPFITTIRNDIDWLREEVRSIPFKIFYKGTATLYESFITAVDRFGEIFVYTYREDAGRISRSMLSPFGAADSTPQNKPFIHKSRRDFSGTIKSWISLDEGYRLDAGESLWKLDTDSSEISTNHIGIEYWLDRIIKKENKDGLHNVIEDFLMTKEYLDYLDANIEFGRRTKEVPHIGSQLSVQTDLSGLYNSFDASMDYSIPDLKLKIAARPDLLIHAPSGFDIEYVEFGVGTQKLASVQQPNIPFPLELNHRVAKVPVLFRDHYENDEYIGAVGEYLGQMVQEMRLLSGVQWFDGVNKSFNFVLPIVPIQRGKVVVEFRLPESSESAIYPIEDDKRGRLLSIYGNGQLDYKTGLGSLTTDFKYTSQETIISQPSDAVGRRRFVQELVAGSTAVITAGSIWLSFMIGEGVNQKMYLAQDNGEGVFIHPKIINGTINYQTRILDITFTEPLVDPSIKPFNCNYSYHINYTLPEGTELWAKYYFTQQTISITEAGFRSRDGTLIIYAAFPPIEFSSTKYHCNFLALVKKNAV